jgi:cardiolipin synthase A/B
MLMPSSHAKKPDEHRGAGQERVVFAPDERVETILSVIGSAKERVILSVFRCDDFRVLDALADALRRNVEVDVLLTGRARGWQKQLHQLWPVLESMGARLHQYADPVVKYHAKYIVADNQLALVASLNFTRKCLTGTVDFILTTGDPQVVLGLKRLFEADCRAPGTPLPKRFPSRLIIGPEQARRQFTSLIEKARHSIRIIDPKLTDPAMMTLLKAKKAAGVVVTVLGRGAIGGLVSHGKLMLVDETTAVIGSLALSALCLDFRREVSVVIRDRRCVNQLNELFERLASRSPGARASSPPKEAGS